jgi:hypothetical protein
MANHATIFHRPEPSPPAAEHRLETTVFVALISSLAVVSYTVAGVIF